MSFQHFLGATFFLASHFKASWKTPCPFSIYFLCCCGWWASPWWENSLLLYKRSACFSCLVPPVLSLEIIPHLMISSSLWCCYIVSGTGYEKKLTRNMLISCSAVGAIAVMLRWLLMSSLICLNVALYHASRFLCCVDIKDTCNHLC